MENYEEESNAFNFFDKLETIFLSNSENAVCVESEDLMTDIYIENEELPTHTMISHLKNVFQDELMNEHIGTVELLGDLGYTDVLWYYCMVMDFVSIHKGFEDKNLDKKIQTPEGYIESVQNNEEVKFDVDVKCNETETAKLKKLISYLKNREFCILANTFYSDGADFIILLVMKSTVGYNLRLKVIVKCKDEEKANTLKVRFAEQLNQFS